MVQFFQQLPDQGQEQASAIAKGFGGGVSQGIKTGLSKQLSGFLEQKKELGKAATSINLVAKRYGKDAFDAPKLAELQNRTSQLIREQNLSAQDASLLAFMENDQKSQVENQKAEATKSGFSNYLSRNQEETRKQFYKPQKEELENLKKAGQKTAYPFVQAFDFLRDAFSPNSAVEQDLIPTF